MPKKDTQMKRRSITQSQEVVMLFKSTTRTIVQNQTQYSANKIQNDASTRRPLPKKNIILTNLN